jgi:hypothetical protein
VPATVTSGPSAAPLDLAEYDETWLRETVFVVRHVGDDATVDLQPDLNEDYVIEVVPTAAVKPGADALEAVAPTSGTPITGRRCGLPMCSAGR